MRFIQRMSYDHKSFADALINLVIYQLMKAPALIGRRLLDKIAGFRHCLLVAEEGRGGVW